ncbi:unnamed protein product [Rotaria socialis]|uniref:ALMS motif domain-containing protein n=1 Tax=Rotaria socialis TaxID=392032 RepID=A0A818ESR8_9BILA|nr:unnamed protein product [Rotaria socialis]CAF4314720.1 unnamed protein product [Rotaria socialis]
MSKYVQTSRNTSQSPTSLSIDALEEIVRNCQRNEERLHELERHTRHERKKAERLLQETYRTMQDGDSQSASILENKTNNDNNYVDHQKLKQQATKKFFVSLDDENEENENLHHRPRQAHNKNNEVVSQNKHLLERVEKLLAGDGTTTSSDIMSSQERQKKITEKSTSPVEDDLGDKSLNTDQKDLSESHQLQSECSIDYDLSAVDHLLTERTPINSHRMKSDVHSKPENQIKQSHNYNDKKQNSSDKRNQQFYERFDDYLETDRSVSSRPTITTAEDQVYQYKPPVTSKLTDKDEELADLARRCEDLLVRLHSQRSRAVMLENSTHHYDYHQQPSPTHTPAYEPNEYYHQQRALSPPLTPTPPPPPMEGPPLMSLQQALELLRPDFISRSRQRARRIRLLREEREHQNEIERERQEMLLFSCATCCSNPSNRSVSTRSSRSVSASSSSRRSIAYTVPYERLNSSRVSSTYREMKQATKKKYDQLPEVNNRRRQNQMDEIRRRNLLRAKVFRARLRQHVVRNGRTNINESLSIIDT